MGSSTVYIKKKAALAATRIIRKVPEKIDEYIDKIELLMEERQHSKKIFKGNGIQYCCQIKFDNLIFLIGILLSCLSLIQDVVNLAPHHKPKFKKFVPSMVSKWYITGIYEP